MPNGPRRQRDPLTPILVGGGVLVLGVARADPLAMLVGGGMLVVAGAPLAWRILQRRRTRSDDETLD